jgi:cyclophilin family peptidyl-prolyl cis-trans isomerase
MRAGSIIQRGLLGLLAGLTLAIPSPAQEAESQPESQPAVRAMTRAPSTTSAPAAARVVLDITCGGEDWGRLVIELDPGKAPATVENFLHYVDAGFYDGTIFHRVVPDFLIQGGGWTSPTEPKKDGLQKSIRNEARNALKNERGTIAMARTRNPASATTQFFINLDDNPKLDFPDGDGWGYCAFGKVVEGLNVVDRIGGVPTQRNSLADNDTTPSLPIDPPMIKRAYRFGSGPTVRPAAPRAPTSQPQPQQQPPPPPPAEEYNQPGGAEQPPEPVTPNQPEGE